MRIAHLILTRRFAGSERYAVELANAQAAAGDEVVMVLRRAAAQPRPDAIAHRLAPAVKLELVPDLFAQWHARRRLRQLRPEVAHAHLSGACRALQGLRRDTCLRVATLHIAYKPQQHAALDALVAIAPWQFEAVPARLRPHTVQLDNWTLPAAPSAGARARLRAQLGIAADAPVFGALGRAESGKGFDLLLDAFLQLGDPRAWLVIAGQGRELQALRRRASGHPRIVLPGFVDRPRDWLELFDVFVSAARDEPFGLVLLEAMEAGLPIVATASFGARHLAPAIGSALVPCGDAPALAAALAAAPRSRRAYPMDRFRIQTRLPEFTAFYQRELRTAAPT
jgi:glycosyltransferase involved in cell wall biosynthesis